jgi:hypothetical protein
VIQAVGLETVQAQPDCVVTVIVEAPPAAANGSDSGVTV